MMCRNPIRTTENFWLDCLIRRVSGSARFGRQLAEKIDVIECLFVLIGSIEMIEPDIQQSRDIQQSAVKRYSVGCNGGLPERETRTNVR